MVVGHKKQIDYLNKIFFSNNIPHAFIFEGLSGLGKKHLALYFFKKINCTEKFKKKPCNKCKNCILSNQLNHPDLNVVEPEGKEIKIFQIKEIIHKMSFCRYFSPLKWVIINDAHLMNKEASNSLLKILEEPSKNTVIILVTSNPNSIFNTVRSRAQKIKFYPLQEKEIIFLLEKLECSNDKIKEIASFSFGVPGKAFEFALDYSKIKKRKEKIKELKEITSPKKPFHLKFQYAKKISDDSQNLKETLEIWLSYLRIIILEKSKENKIDRSFYKIKNYLELIEKSIYLISKTNTNNRLIIENLILNL